VEKEEFLGIGMDEHIKLRSFEVIIPDEETQVAIYLNRDSDNRKVESTTKSVLIIVCGLSEIYLNDLECAKETVIK
jgi:DNA/RNA-binding domain of Phe-tRNA-synthetase-like protein